MATERQDVPIHDFNAANYVGTDPLLRDQRQSVRLHEPTRRVATKDPITGREILDPEGYPQLVDGDLTIVFECEATRRAFLDMPTDHPFRLTDNPTAEGYDEG